VPMACQVRSTSRGIEGLVDGRSLVVGSAAMVRELDLSERLIDAEQEYADQGLTPVLVALDGRIVGIAGMGDPVRRDARSSIDALRAMGWRVGILSGDHPDVVAAVGEHLGLDSCDVVGGVTPEDKLAFVQRLSGTRAVVMVGDGVNDAAALAVATVGVAVHGGAEASLAAADVYLSRPGLSPIVELARASQRTMNVIRRNLAASLFYNLLAATLAATGAISPLLAAILMPASSLTVLTLSFRSRTFRGDPCP